MYKIWLINFCGWASEHMREPLTTMEQAIARCKEIHFECAIMKMDDRGVMLNVATWSPLSGTHMLPTEF